MSIERALEFLGEIIAAVLRVVHLFEHSELMKTLSTAAIMNLGILCAANDSCNMFYIFLRKLQYNFNFTLTTYILHHNLFILKSFRFIWYFPTLS